MKVNNITSNRGNKIPNQFIITDNNGTEYFQSYKSIIVKRTLNNTYLDEYYWEYSVTTGKYRNIFLNETKKETLKKIKNGIYKLTNLYNWFYEKNTIIFYNKASQNKINQLIKKDIKLIKLATDKNNFFDLKSVLNKIYSFGCRNLLVEGGKSLTSSFLEHNLFEQFYLFKSPNKLDKSAKLNISNQLNQLSFKYKKKSKLNAFTGKDVVYIYSK